MARRKKYKKREIAPERIYHSRKVAKMINYLMRKGKKTIAEKIVYQAFELIKKKTKKDPLSVFEKALENVGPLLEVKPRRVGGATYQVPVKVREERKYFLAMNWIIETARQRKGKPMEEKLAEEIIKAFKNEGEAVKKRERMHKLAEANKAFAHFAF